MWHLAVRSLGRAAAAPHPEGNSRDLRELENREHRMKNRMLQRQIDERVGTRWQYLPDLALPDLPGVIPPEIVGPQESALEQVIVEVPGFHVIEIDVPDLRHHDERAVEQFRIGEPDHQGIRFPRL